MARGKYEYWLTEDGLLLLAGWARDGLTDEQMAQKMRIATSTLYDWKKKYSEISEAVKKGKEIVDFEVENALLKRAKGYSYNEDKYAVVDMNQDEFYQRQQAFMNEYRFNHPEATQDEIIRMAQELPKDKIVLVERKTKEVVPDTTALIFWLKNRRPDKWRDKQSTELSGDINIVNQYQSMTDDELSELIKRYEAINSE